MDKQCRLGEIWSESASFANESASFGGICLLQCHFVQSLRLLQQLFGVSENFVLTANQQSCCCGDNSGGRISHG